MKYAALIVEYVFSRTLVRTDILSAVVTALLPAAYYLAGKQIPENYAVLISLWIAASVAVILILRLLAAPYVIWKRDGAEIARLQTLLGDTAAKRRQFFEERFLEDRAALARELAKFVALERIFGKLHTIDIDAELRPITSTAFMFLGDPGFDLYWRNFTAALRNAHGGVRFIELNQDTLSADARDLIRKRAAYDLQVVATSAAALVAILTENIAHAQQYDAAMRAINAQFDDIDLSLDPRSRWALPTQPLPTAQNRDGAAN